MHETSLESFRRAVDAGISSIAHYPLDEKLEEEDLRAFAESECLLEPTCSVAFGLAWKIKGNQWRDHPLLQRLSEHRHEISAELVEEFWPAEMHESVMRGLTRFEQGKLRMMGLINMANMFSFYATIGSVGLENVGALCDAAGLSRISCGNDGGMPPLVEAMVGLELATIDFCLDGEFSTRKLSGADALRIATLNSARSLGVEDRFGTITTGKTADLVVLDGDPLADYDVIGARAAAVFKDGCLVLDGCGLQPL